MNGLRRILYLIGKLRVAESLDNFFSGINGDGFDAPELKAEYPGCLGAIEGKRVLDGFSRQADISLDSSAVRSVHCARERSVDMHQSSGDSKKSLIRK